MTGDSEPSFMTIARLNEEKNDRFLKRITMLKLYMKLPSFHCCC